MDVDSAIVGSKWIVSCSLTDFMRLHVDRGTPLNFWGRDQTNGNTDRSAVKIVTLRYHHDNGYNVTPQVIKRMMIMVAKIFMLSRIFC